MNISGIRISAGFYDYNSIEKRQTEQTALEQSRSAEGKEAVPVAGPEREQEEQASVEPVRTKPDSGAIDYAKRYQPDAAYELKGADSDIARLDVERALSDMRKDQILEQYQFFVGAQEAGTEAGRESENFYL